MISIIPPWLSAFKLTGWSESLYPRAIKNCDSQSLFSASVVAIYSTWVEEGTIVADYFVW